MTTLTVMEATLLQPTADRKPSLAYVAVAGLVGALCFLRWGGIRKGIWVDLDVYARGADAVIRHQPLYDVSVHGLPFTYPPFAAVLFTPLELLGSIGARWALTLVSIACYALIVIVCARGLKMKPATAALVGLAGLTFEPFLRTILLGQINLVLLALVVVDCLVVPARYRGMMIGLAAGIKLVPGAFVLFLVIKREWGAVGRAGAAFVVSLAVGGLLAPRDSWLFWRGGFINLSRFGPAAILGGDNQSLNAAIMRLTHDLTPPSMLVLAMSVGAMALGLVAAKRQIDSGNEVNGLVCIAFGALLASPVSWTHHWMWAVVALLVLVASRRRLAAAVLGVIFVVGPMWLAYPGQLRELTHNGWQVAACLSYVAVGLAYLVFFAVSRPRPAKSPGGGAPSGIG
jgi:alpha-1,2-mannosyltransferase